MKWIIGIAVFSLLVFLLFNSSSSSSTTTNDDSSTSAVDSNASTDEDIDSDIDYDSSTFNGYPCTVDCSGHEAGYEWAEENGITQDDVDSYSGNSNSFMEGMQSYVDEN